MISKLTVIIISAIVITVLDSKCITEATQTTTEELNQNNQQVYGESVVGLTTVLVATMRN